MQSSPDCLVYRVSLGMVRRTGSWPNYERRRRAAATVIRQFAFGSRSLLLRRSRSDPRRGRVQFANARWGGLWSGGGGAHRRLLSAGLSLPTRRLCSAGRSISVGPVAAAIPHRSTGNGPGGHVGRADHRHSPAGSRCFGNLQGFGGSTIRSRSLDHLR